LTKLRADGYTISGTYNGADVVIVNTCGFLDSAKIENLEAIREALDENGRVIVTGCLGADENAIRDVHPDVLSVSGPHQYETVVAAVHEAAPPVADPLQDVVPPEGIRLTPRHYAYLKISEGCNQRCSFCIIPSMRGDLVSRPASHVIAEAERLVDAGVQELLMVSQDTGAYGTDLKYAKSTYKDWTTPAQITDLCRDIGSFGAWVRLHYIYPYPHINGLIPLMAEGVILPYLDIPFQHASPTVLKAMRRPAHQETTLGRIKQWQADCPKLAIRSTFIVGFPGETEDDFFANSCSGWKRPNWIGSAVSNTRTSMALRRTISPAM
jgi:ribosomal protein S12 methylthiotransferase